MYGYSGGKTVSRRFEAGLHPLLRRTKYTTIALKLFKAMDHNSYDSLKGSVDVLMLSI